MDYVFPEVMTRGPHSEPPASPELISFTIGLLSGKIQRNRRGKALTVSNRRCTCVLINQAKRFLYFTTVNTVL